MNHLVYYSMAQLMAQHIDLLAELPKRIDVLDHGFVELLDSMPRLVPAGQTAEGAIVRAARISTIGHNYIQRAGEADANLLRYLFENGHTSPFEQTNVTFAIHCPMFVKNHFVRHRMPRINEFSQRYAQIKYCVQYKPSKFVRRIQSSTNTQGSVNTQEVDEHLQILDLVYDMITRNSDDNRDIYQLSPKLDQDSSRSELRQDNYFHTIAEEIYDIILAFLAGDDDILSETKKRHAYITELRAVEAHAEQMFVKYEHMIELGMPREQARVFLPNSTYTVFIWNIDLNNLVKFMRLRCDEHTQWETRVFADAICNLVRPLYPITLSMYDASVGGMFLTGLEVQFIQTMIKTDATDAANTVKMSARDRKKMQEKLEKLKLK